MSRLTSALDSIDEQPSTPFPPGLAGPWHSPPNAGATLVTRDVAVKTLFVINDAPCGMDGACHSTMDDLANATTADADKVLVF